VHHLTLDVYLMLLEGRLPPRTLAAALHRHLLEICPHCDGEWQAAAPLRDEARASGEIAAHSTPPDAAAAIAFSSASRRLEERAERLRSTRRQAREDLRRMLATPPERREEKIVQARTRYRSRAFCELLIEHCRERVRSDAGEAATLLELVGLALLWTPGGLEAGWAHTLAARAEAHRANALRVAGDLPAAERLFAEVRRRLARLPLDEAKVYAEVASLEASLLWDQRRYAEAAELLDGAVLVYHDAGEREGLARVLIKRASILQGLDRGGDALADLARARSLLDPKEETFLYLFTVVGTVPLLLDEGRPEEADRLLTDAEDAFEAAREPWWALRLRYLEGRAALARGDLARAELRLGEARDGFRDQGLPQDTANASLDLALVHLHQGETAEVRRLCREIAPYFRAAGVERDALAALALFARATEADAAALARVAELRRHLSGRARPPRASS